MREEQVEVEGVPARVFVPAGACALLLLGHGGGHGKDAKRFVGLARHYAAGTGLAVLCIDAVDHGERRPPAAGPGIPREWHSRAADRMVRDWGTVAGALAAIGPTVAYVGFSMGAIFGVMTVAAMTSIRAAVFVVGGIPTGGGIDDPPLRGLLLDAASRLAHAHVLMSKKTDDELFPAAGTRELFDAIPGDRKRLTFRPGGHDDWPPEMIEESVAFVREHGAPGRAHLTRFS